MRDIIKVVIIAPRDFEALALLQAFETRKEVWLKMQPVADRYPAFRLDAEGPKLDVAVVSCGDQTASYYARRSLNAFLELNDSRIRPVAFFLCGTGGAAAHLRDKDGARIGDILLPLTSLQLSSYSIGPINKLRGMAALDDFDDSDVGKRYLLSIREWLGKAERLIGLDLSSLKSFRANNLSSDVMLADAPLMEGIKNAPGIEACEMELGAVCEVVSSRYGGINSDGFPTVQMIKGISDFIGSEHRDADRRVAAMHSAYVTLAILEDESLRKIWNARVCGQPAIRPTMQSISTLLNKIVASVQTSKPLTEEDWEHARRFAATDQEAYENVLRALDAASEYACPGCGARMEEASALIRGAEPLLRDLPLRLDASERPFFPAILRNAVAAGFDKSLHIHEEFINRVLSFVPERSDVQDYRRLLVALLYLPDMNRSLAVRVLNRAIHFSEDEFGKKSIEALKSRSCQICVFARHCVSETERVAVELKNDIATADIPKQTRKSMLLAVDIRLFHYRYLTFDWTGKHADVEREALVTQAKRLLEQSKNINWRDPNIWRTGLRLALARLTSTEEDLRTAMESIGAHLKQGGQLQHCMHDVAEWSRFLLSVRES